MPASLVERATDLAPADPAAVATLSDGLVVDPSIGLDSDDASDSSGGWRLGAFPVPWRYPIRCTVWLVRAVFGLGSLVLLLAVLAAIPIVNVVALGYLLEVEGRVARTGKIKSGFLLLDVAPRLGAIALGVYLWLIPLRLIASASADAQIINPGGTAARNLAFVSATLWAAISAHLCLALARGGSFWTFFRPLKNLLWFRKQMREGDYWEHASAHIRDFIGRLQLRHHFSLGLRGFFVAFLWLVIPSAFFAAGKPQGLSALMPLLGGLMLIFVFSWVPFLQARFAATNQFRAGFELRAVRNLFPYAPFAWLVTLLVVYASALPIYLFKGFLLPPDALWPITLIFIVANYPARVLTGWAYHRAVARQTLGRRSWWITRAILRFPLMLAILLVFVAILFFTQYIGEHGRAELFKHHAFLLPWPYLLPWAPQ
jgi:hypothetical protein